MDVNTGMGSINVNNLNLFNKFKSFFIKWEFNEDHIINGIYV
ncbi:hypothetical protein QIA36_04860 [Borreliella yangtzensis]